MRVIDKLLQGKKLILFGAGALCAQTLILELDGYDVAYICDNDPKKWDTTFMGIPVKAPKILLEENPDQILVVITSMYQKQIEWVLRTIYEILTFDNIFDVYPTEANDRVESLRKQSIRRYEQLSLHKSEVDKVYGLLSDQRSQNIFNNLIENYKNGVVYFGNIIANKTQYFNDIFSDCLTEDEVYIDVGVLDGDTILQFIQYADNKYKKVYGFEPDAICYHDSLKRFRNVTKKVALIQGALSDENGEMGFDMSTTAGSRFNEDSTVKVKTFKLDDIVDEKVTFIKMDVEGAEERVLKGAQNTIKTHKPKLAISVYHQDDDLWRLPLLIHEMVPEYKFYIEHHGLSIYETVLYAKI